MTRDTPDISDWGILTEPAFESALQTLLRAALAEDIDPFGAWAYRGDETQPDLEVIVSELGTRSAEE